ncbi:hypothetical protein L208DRAFT_1514885 [Tricholoma matsutake]|nr:hypothetical protein L208DRAFT_1514885 [Tricholoma matsutake 945]
MQHLKAETHTTCHKVLASGQEDKGTYKGYRHHIDNYKMWFIQDQACRLVEDPEWTIINPFPITAMKVALFLEYETTHDKA